ncbi:ParB/RepB/Spo0J family partition protein [Clostridium magnum]|uniref:Uncharacterized protein n=1 Tax=Clostridium magnum DSM 2767 TaxID=1121326 RepID=A0A162QRY0_9CLOT|nr:ParB/RepB/Spo0J family partition protein [Clostridium magnum]KZL88884.1 hypothetical protein CLMAG_57880 [Clostridium magnum DSM 2767]SHI51497.1 ParB-like nuclease domain-containing protein [Clostridium magnum DSM 2767]
MNRNGRSENYTPTPRTNIQVSTTPGAQLIDLALLEPAPKSWNFYTPLSDFKMATLKESILNRGGIINPIIVWERQGANGKTYMILSGHNRVAAYKDILQMAEEKGYSEYINIYNKIPAIIKGELEIDDNEAEQIIIDCNWAQRELTPMEKNKSIIRKYTLVKESPNTLGLGEGKTRDKIAVDFNITGRQIQKYMSLSNLIEEWQSILNEGDISLKLALKLLKLNKEKQEYIFNTHFDSVVSHGTKAETVLGSIKTNTTFKNIDLLFENMLKDIETEKEADTSDVSMKFSFKLSKSDAEKLKALSKEEKLKMQKEIEKLVKSKFLS